MTKPKKLSKPGNFGGSKSRTSARGAKSQGIGSASKMEVVDAQDFNDLSEKQLGQLFDAYAQATGLANAGERRMLATVLEGSGRQGEYAKNLHHVIMSAPNDVRAKMGESGVYLSGAPKTASEQREPIRGVVDSSSQDRDTEPKSDARYQPLVELGRDMLLAPNPEERNRIRAETNAKRDEIGLSEEEKKGYERAVLSMWAEEAVRAWANDDEKIQKRLDQLVSRLGAEDTAFYEQQLREQRAAFIVSGTPKQSETGAEESSGDGVEEGELQNEGVVTAEAEDGQGRLTPGEMVSDLAKKLREGDVVVERKFESKTLEEAKANLARVIKATPGLKVNVDFWGWDRNGRTDKQIAEDDKFSDEKELPIILENEKLSDEDKARIEQDMIDCMDALAQHLEGLPPGYTAVLDDITIKPRKKWRDLTPEQMEVARERLMKEDRYKLENLKKEIVEREYDFYRGEIQQQAEDEARDRVAERILQGRSKLDLQDDEVEQLNKLVADAMNTESVKAQVANLFRAKSLAKAREIFDSPETAAEAEKMIQERLTRLSGAMAQVDDFIAPVSEKDTSGVYPGNTRLILEPGLADKQGFTGWYSKVMSHELGHIKNAAWADSLFSILSAVKDGQYAFVNNKDELALQDFSPEAVAQAEQKVTDAKLALEKAKKSLKQQNKKLTSESDIQAAMNAVAQANEVLSDATAAFKSISDQRRGLIMAHAPEFQNFLDDWQKASIYGTQKVKVRTQIDGVDQEKEISVWAVKDGIDKKKAAKLMNIAFGDQYAGGHIANDNQVKIGMGVREELAEAHRLYNHPLRDKYVNALYASGNKAAADYLVGMFNVIAKYEQLVSENVDAPKFAPKSYHMLMESKKKKSGRKKQK